MNDNLSLTLDQWREQLAQDPNFGPLLQEASQELAEESPPKEFIETLIEMLYETLEAPESYPMVRDEMIQSGAMDEEDIPPEFNEKYIMLMMCALDLVRDNMLSQGFARGGLASLGRNGDSMLAHINPIEARMLIRNGGSGTINPETGLPEFGWASKTWKKVKKTVKKIAKPILTIASIIPSPIQPWALAANSLYSASQGNWLGAALSAFGAYAAPGGFGGFGEAGSSAAGMGGSLGNGISGGLNTTFGALGDGASALAGAGTSGAAGMGSSLGSGISGSLAGAGSAVGSAAGAAAEGLGGLSFSGLGEASLPAMETLGGLGDGVSGSLPSLGETAAPSAWDMYKTAKSIYGPAKTAYNMLNPPEPEQYSRTNTQRQMQQMGGLGMNTNRAFGYGGNQFRNPGMMARVGFRRGGLARCTCKE